MSECYTSKVVGAKLNQRGVTGVTVALVLGMMVMMAAFVIDIGHALVTKNELQNAADSAALAAGRRLGLMYMGWPILQVKDPSYSLTTADQQPIVDAAKIFSLQNRASDLANVALLASDIEIGTWDFSVTNPTFVPTLIQPNAIRVIARRDSTNGGNGPISTFFAGVIGISQMEVSAVSVAALSDAGGVAPPGNSNAPFGLDKKIFDTKSCTDDVNFSPTQDSCAGWHSFTTSPTNKTTIEGQLNGLTSDPPTFISPEVTPGLTEFNFSGGEISNLFGDLQALKTANEAWDTVDGRMEWNINIPVYDDGSSGPCGNPSGAITIVGYAQASVYYVGNGGSDKNIKAQILCDGVFDAAPNPNPGAGPALPWVPLSPYPRPVS